MDRRTIGSSGGWTLLVMACAAGVSAARTVSPAIPQALHATVEIRSYNLKPGGRGEFHRLVVATLPMVERRKIDVVWYGPSAHDSTSYVLIRAFRSLEDRERSEEAFYGGREWREGPRDQVLALIDNYTTVVLDLDSTTVAGLRAAIGR